MKKTYFCYHFNIVCSVSRLYQREEGQKNRMKNNRQKVIKQELQVSAAASLTEVSKALGNEFKRTIQM